MYKLTLAIFALAVVWAIEARSHKSMMKRSGSSRDSATFAGEFCGNYCQMFRNIDMVAESIEGCGASCNEGITATSTINDAQFVEFFCSDGNARYLIDARSKGMSGQELFGLNTRNQRECRDGIFSPTSLQEGLDMVEVLGAF